MDAAQPARDEAALPVDAHATIRLPAAYARETAIADARSFIDAVEFTPSSFTKRVLTPISEARRAALYKGVQPTLRGGLAQFGSTGRKGMYRHMEVSWLFSIDSLLATLAILS